MANLKVPERILVYLRNLSKGSIERAVFKDCILDSLGHSGLEALVSCTLEDNRLVISNPTKETDAVVLKHPSFCPCHGLSSSDVTNITQEVLDRGVDCGVVTLLWSSDQYLLLTRRASHLRNFPGVWVPPGGHLERGETSVYPPLLSRGLPKKHHIVVYQSVTSSKTHQQLDAELKLDANEVGASAWLEESIVRALTKLSEESGEKCEAVLKEIPDTIRGHVVDPVTGKAADDQIPTRVFYQRAPPSGEDIERLSTGSLFAMQSWLKKYSAAS
ncbi:nucleoside diphosphate-linked moiety X motif 17 isoform X2 [Strongylocentrotus purpuratus]|uniref:Nudix hydrolase domain-containing protein n=1 Tax=Strongylocentrotus purpuratus TaxID=7668 RepID=A0A7M7NAZ6_STRPU|nr:nucleoside diphosphate-linked moiety X motif 17 isoform X2 [Strongylocentrotus purpuratus]